MTPRWSPDGDHIAFVRDGTLYVADSGGKRLINLHANTDFYEPSDIQWSPDGHQIAISVSGKDAPHVQIFNIKSRKSTDMPDTVIYLWSPRRGATYEKDAKDSDTLTDPIGKRDSFIIAIRDKPLIHAAWINDRELVGIPESGPLNRCIFSRSDGVETRHIDLKIPKHDPDDSFEPQYLQAIPQNSRAFLFALDRSNSTVRPNRDFYRVDAQNGHMQPFAMGKQFIAFAPDGTQFCTMPARYTVPYEKRDYFKSRPPGSSYRVVWAAPLQIGSTKSGKTRDVTPRLVWVNGVDWRGLSHDR